MEFIKKFIPNLILIEISLFSIFSIGIQYFINKRDPFFINTFFSPTLLMSMVFSLYYGFLGGFIFWGILVLSCFYFYKDFPLQQIIWNLLIVLIASEFRYYWQRRINTAEIEKNYLLEQIKSLRKNLYFLNLSHEQMEFNYIMKSYSLREMINEVRNKLLSTSEEKLLAEFIMNIIMKNFQVYTACLYKKQGNDFTVLASIGPQEQIDENDPMIKNAIEIETAKYISPKIIGENLSNLNNLKYLAVIAAKTEETIYLLTIKDMLFINFNEEVLNYIHTLLQYLLEEFSISRKISNYYTDKEPLCEFEFIKEFYKMYELKKKSQINSSIVVFSCEETENLIHKVSYLIRTSDFYCFVKEKNLIIFLLPFTNYAGAVSFSNRALSELKGVKLLGIYDLDEPTPEKFLQGVEL